MWGSWCVLVWGQKFKLANNRSSDWGFLWLHPKTAVLVIWLWSPNLCNAFRGEAHLTTVYELDSGQSLPANISSCFFPSNYSKPFQLYDKKYICHNRLAFQRRENGVIDVYSTRPTSHDGWQPNSWYEEVVAEAGFKPTWTPTDYWLYTGDSDPICYYQVVYDDWWFTQSNYVDHCVAEMQKQGCQLTKATKEEDDVELFQNKHVIRCTGIRARAAEIKRGSDPNWSRVLVLNPRVLNIHGPVMVYSKGGRYKAISHLALYFSFMYDGNQFRHVTVEHDKRKDIPTKWFVYADLKDPALLVKGTVYPHLRTLGLSLESELIRTDLSLGYSGCSVMGNIAIGDEVASTEYNPPLMWLPSAPMTWANMDWIISLTCETTCACPSHAWSFFEDGGLEHLKIDNQEKSWIIRIMDQILRWILDLIGDVASLVFSPRLTDALFRALLVYLVAKHLTGDAIVPVIVSGSLLGWWVLSN